MRKKGAAKLKGGGGVRGGEGGIAICSLWATGAENLEAKGERSRTVEGPCTRNRRGGPRNYEAAQVLNHIPLNAVPEAICSLGTTGAENLEDKGERSRTVAGPCTLDRRGRATANFQSFKLSTFQTFKGSNFQTFNFSNFQTFKV